MLREGDSLWWDENHYTTAIPSHIMTHWCSEKWFVVGTDTLGTYLVLLKTPGATGWETSMTGPIEDLPSIATKVLRLVLCILQANMNFMFLQECFGPNITVITASRDKKRETQLALRYVFMYLQCYLEMYFCFWLFLLTSCSDITSFFVFKVKLSKIFDSDIKKQLQSCKITINHEARCCSSHVKVLTGGLFCNTKEVAWIKAILVTYKLGLAVIESFVAPC